MLIVETENHKLQFSNPEHLAQALINSAMSQGKRPWIEGRSGGLAVTMMQMADVVFHKGSGKYLKHRQVGDQLANEILEFANA